MSTSLTNGDVLNWIDIRRIWFGREVLVLFDKMFWGDSFNKLVLVLLLHILVIFFCFALGQRLLRGRRQGVLFLRRFGHQGSTSIVSAAAARLGRYWRFVTLDDAKIVALGAGVSARAAGVLVGGAGFVSTVVRQTRSRIPTWRVFAPLARWWKRSGSTVLSRWKLAAASSWIILFAGVGVHMLLTWNFGAYDTIGDDGEPFTVGTVMFFVGGLGTILFFFLPVLFMAAWAAWAIVIFPIIPLFVGAWTKIASLAFADRSRTATVSSIEELKRTTFLLGEVSRKEVFRPRLSVLKVNSVLWQDAVTELAAVSSTILIDISEPTLNLVWELEVLSVDYRDRLILVGEARQVERFATGRGLSPRERRLVELSAGHPVLTYTANRECNTQFRSALRNRLESVVANADRR